jgi:hypothetical protein
MIEWMLLFSAFLLPAVYAWRHSVDRGRIRIDHVALFSLGFIFYWVTPIACGFFLRAEDMPLAWAALFDLRWIGPYLIAIVALYAAFMAGDRCGAWIYRPKMCRAKMFRAKLCRPKTLRPRSLSPQILGLFSGGAFLILLAEIAAHREELLAPYTTEVSLQIARGNVTAWVVLLGSILLLRLSSHPRFTVLMLPFAAGAIFLVLIGSRLYVASFVLMFGVFRSLYICPFSKKQIIFAAASLAALFGTVGALRVNSSIADAGVNLLLEPVLTSISLVYFLGNDHLIWLAAPKYLLSDFSNLIPSALFPGKAALIQAPEVFSPLGALHSFVSFSFNFGLIGTAAFMFLLPVGLRWIKARDGSPLYRTMYVMLSGWLAFTFFRDPFSVSLVKTMFQHSILLPAAMVAFIRLAELAGQGVVPAQAGGVARFTTND